MLGGEHQPDRTHEGVDTALGDRTGEMGAVAPPGLVCADERLGLAIGIGVRNGGGGGRDKPIAGQSLQVGGIGEPIGAQDQAIRLEHRAWASDGGGEALAKSGQGGGVIHASLRHLSCVQAIRDVARPDPGVKA
jgi:hypothetical protein